MGWEGWSQTEHLGGREERDGCVSVGEQSHTELFVGPVGTQGFVCYFLISPTGRRCTKAVRYRIWEGQRTKLAV